MIRLLPADYKDGRLLMPELASGLMVSLCNFLEARRSLR